MAFITRNASVTLLFMILITITVLIGSTVTYQMRLSDLNHKHDTQLANLKELEDKAAKLTDEMNSALRARELAIARGSQFAVTYSELKSEQETAEAKRDRLISEKQELESSIAGSQREFTEARALNEETERQNAALLIQKQAIMEEKLRKENTLRSLKRELDDLQEAYAKLKQ